METIKTTARIHPLMAAAAVSVIVVSLAGAAAITGLLPSSHSAPQPDAGATQATPYAASQAAAPLPGVPADAAPTQQAVAAVQPTPAPAPKPAHPVRHHTSYARNDAPAY